MSLSVHRGGIAVKRLLVLLGLAILAALLLCCTGAVAKAQALTFAAHSDFATGQVPVVVAVGDFNKDGKLDVVTDNDTDNTVSVLLGDGAGHFAAHADFATGAGPWAVAVGDLDGDGLPDVVTPNYTDNTVSVLLDTTTPKSSTLEVAAHVDLTVGNSPAAVAIGDLNGDGKPDLVVANFADNTVSVLLNTTSSGVLSFAAPVDYSTGSGSGPWWVAIGDFNADGKTDLAVADETGNAVSVLLGNGDGTFGARTDFSVGQAPVVVVASDLSGDGKPDLVTANYDDSTASVLLNTAAKGAATPSFATAVGYTTGTDPSSVAVGDMNGDGKKDLVVSNYSDNSVSILPGAGNGTFASKTDFAAGAVTDMVAVGDFDSDGRQDLVTANYGANTISLLLNTTRSRITAIKPARGKVGTTVTITGTSFGVRRGKAKVYFGPKAVTKYVSWSMTKIRVKVPKLGAGKKTVTVRTAGGKSNAKTFTVT